jgi:hypothetical protein
VDNTAAPEVAASNGSAADEPGADAAEAGA